MQSWKMALNKVTSFFFFFQFGDLVSWLHGQPPGAEVLNEFDISELESGINEVLAYRADNPAWLTERMQTRVQVPSVVLFFALLLKCSGCKAVSVKFPYYRKMHC